MHALIPLLLIFVALNGQQLKNDKLYRANVFAIVGLCYFILLPYVYYWNRVFQLDSWAASLPVLAVVIIAVGVSLSRWNRRSHPIKTGFLCAFFSIFLVASYSIDWKIKEWLAEKGGFFVEGASLVNVRGLQPANQKFEFSNIGVELSTSEEWRASELPSGHRYLTYSGDSQALLEVRPNCLDGARIDTPTYIANKLELMGGGKTGVTQDHQCLWDGVSKQCLIKLEYSSAGHLEQRWHWLNVLGDKQAFVMDFIMRDASTSTETQALALMASTKSIQRRRALNCHTPAAWL